MLRENRKDSRGSGSLKRVMFVKGYVGLVNMMRRFTNKRSIDPQPIGFTTSFITLTQMHKQKNNS
ncbi:hypothetical protein HanIR_Chr05g0234881 [Helianthus annuus]|nr:hypothetical protein HanIR_Chr05g0234881 [Helianthus annuus]